MEYLKINSLYKREGHDFDSTRVKPKGGKLIMGEYARPEFAAIKTWLVDEKIDGTNIRITFTQDKQVPDSAKISIGGRTANAQIPCALLDKLQSLFTVELFLKQFPTCSHVVLFGEGYGPKIQSGGYYSKEPDFILFDVFCGGWWLEKTQVIQIGQEMGLNVCHMLQNSAGPVWSVEQIVMYVKNKYNSPLAATRTGDQHEMEGVVARSYPLMLFRDGTPVMFKLKCKEFD